jgi:uncharacterized protein YjiS (DUF1127 family)
MADVTDFNSRPGNGPVVPFAEVVQPMNHVADGLSQAGLGIARMFAGTGAAIHRRIRFNRTVSALSSLSDHTLRDIGIDRSAIVDVARDLADR